MRDDLTELGVALAGICWADGEMAESERRELLACLRSLGLTEAQTHVVMETAREPVLLEDAQVRATPLSTAREVVALGRRIARADGQFTEVEAGALLSLFSRLRRD